MPEKSWKLWKPKKVKARDGSVLLMCPRCGHVFKNNKQYVRHLFKAHFEVIKQLKKA
ncbi:MAG: nucleotide-binding protein [bacterium]|nr:nucleotide-binding protein [bacterium]